MNATLLGFNVRNFLYLAVSLASAEKDFGGSSKKVALIAFLLFVLLSQNKFYFCTIPVQQIIFVKHDWLPVGLVCFYETTWKLEVVSSANSKQEVIRMLNLLQ